MKRRASSLPENARRRYMLLVCGECNRKLHPQHTNSGAPFHRVSGPMAEIESDSVACAIPSCGPGGLFSQDVRFFVRSVTFSDGRY